MNTSIMPLTVKQLNFSAMGSPPQTIEIIRNISTTFEAGTSTFIVGPNGAGKSVLLRLLHGLLAPTNGSIAWQTDNKKAQAMVFQKPMMLRRNVKENVEFALKVAGYSRGQASERVMASLEKTGITHLADRPARLCSGGEQQRIALARAWALNPQILFLDEPTANLDPQATKAIEAVIESMHLSGTAIVMTSHDLGQVKRLAKRVLFLHRGQVLEDCSVSQFFVLPPTTLASLFTRGELLC